jgi:hypothetical protein
MGRVEGPLPVTKTRNVPIEPPPGLSERSLRVWTAEAGARTQGAGRLLLLEECLKHLDQADKLAAVIAVEGSTTTTKTTGTVHLHPLLKLEQAHRAQFAKLAKVLSLEWETGVDGRDW